MSPGPIIANANANTAVAFLGFQFLLKIPKITSFHKTIILVKYLNLFTSECDCKLEIWTISVS